jgi:hypothetical protein
MFPMKKIILFVLVVSIFSCKNDDSNNQTDMLNINLVSGINLRETADQVPLRFGNPNIFVSNQLVVYPNLAYEVINIYSQNVITDVYFISGWPEKIHQNVDFNDILNSGVYAESTISGLSTLKFNGTDLFSTFNISNLEAGYYRVFIKTNNQFYWDNFYKTNSPTSNTQIENISTFWN